jgi:hypothetical protein
LEHSTPQLVVMRLDLEELAEKPSNEIPGFYEGLIAVLPSLEEHFCSPGIRGGFLSRDERLLCWQLFSSLCHYHNFITSGFFFFNLKEHYLTLI